MASRPDSGWVSSVVLIKTNDYNLLFMKFPLRFVPSSIDRLFRGLVRTNKASRTKDFQSHDILQMLLQLQEKHSKNSFIIIIIIQNIVKLFSTPFHIDVGRIFIPSLLCSLYRF